MKMTLMEFAVKLRNYFEAKANIVPRTDQKQLFAEMAEIMGKFSRQLGQTGLTDYEIDLHGIGSFG